MKTYHKAVDRDGNPVALVIAGATRAIIMSVILDHNKPDQNPQVQISEQPTFKDARDTIGVDLHEIDATEFNAVLKDQWNYEGSEDYLATEDRKEPEDEEGDKIDAAGQAGPGRPEGSADDNNTSDTRPMTDEEKAAEYDRQIAGGRSEDEARAAVYGAEPTPADFKNRVRVRRADGKPGEWIDADSAEGKLILDQSAEEIAKAKAAGDVVTISVNGGPEYEFGTPEADAAIAELKDPAHNDRTQNGTDVAGTPVSTAPVEPSGGPHLDDNSVAKDADTRTQ